MTKTRSTYLALLAVLLSPLAANADLIGNGNFDGGLNTSAGTISGTTGPFGEWLAFSGHWQISNGAASNTTSYAENPDNNYLMMQGVDLSAFTSSFDSVLSFDYAYEGGFGGLDGRGVRVFGMESSDTQNLFAPWFSSLDLIFSQVLSPTGNPTTAFQPFTSSAFSVDPAQYSALLVAFTFGGSPTSGELRAVDNVSLSGPTAVPEPSTLGLLGLGLIGMAAIRRKKA